MRSCYILVEKCAETCWNSCHTGILCDGNCPGTFYVVDPQSPGFHSSSPRSYHHILVGDLPTGVTVIKRVTANSNVIS